jgi:putative salt-induced outer membrane protein
MEWMSVMNYVMRSVCQTVAVAAATAGIWGISLSSVAFAQAPAAAPAGPPPNWAGTAGAGVSVTSGNSDTMNYNLAFDLTRTPKGRNVMKWNALYLRGDQNNAVIVNRTSAAYRDEFTLSGRTFLFGQVDYLRDTFKLIDYLVAPTAGLGFNIVNTDMTKFSVDGGAGSISEKNPGVDIRTSGAVTASEKLQLQLTPTSSIKHGVSGLWKANDFADGLYTSSIGLATKISDRLQLSIDLLDTFKNRPPTAATKKNDVAFVTAITAKF